MQIINNTFYIFLFTTVIGSVFTIFSVLLNYVFRTVLPLWSGALGMVLYVFPILAPGLFLVSPETQVWLKGYRVVCIIWVCGIALLVLYNLLKILFAYRAIRSCQICVDESIHTICAQCAQAAGLKKVPTVYFGTLDDPACVIGVLHPIIILNEEAVNKLTEEQLFTVLAHEVTHIKRGHMILGKIYDWVCILHWFNPLAWTARKEFDVLCETDCDKKALAVLKDKISDKEYVLTMLHLLELSAAQISISGNRLSALGFLLTKQRITLVLDRQSMLKKIILVIALFMAVITTIYFSITASRGHFYPYPAYNTGLEYSCKE